MIKIPANCLILVDSRAYSVWSVILFKTCQRVAIAFLISVKMLAIKTRFPRALLAKLAGLRLKCYTAHLFCSPVHFLAVF